MASVNDQTDILNATRASQIIVGALCLGVVGFMGLVLILGPGKPEGPPKRDRPAVLEAGEPEEPIHGAGGAETTLGLPPITLAATLMGAVCLVASFLVPRAVTDGTLRRLAGRREGAPRPDESLEGRVTSPTAVQEVLGVFQSQLIAGAALAEGGAFFSLIAYMLERSPLALVVALALLAALFLKFPTADRVAGWLDEKRGALNEMRQGLA